MEGSRKEPMLMKKKSIDGVHYWTDTCARISGAAVLPEENLMNRMVLVTPARTAKRRLMVK